jgi:hypothetical protein
VTGIRFRNPEVRMSAALAGAEAALPDPVVSLRELLAALGEQGLLVFCGVLAAPFLLPVTVPGMSTVLAARHSILRLHTCSATDRTCLDSGRRCRESIAHRV